MIQFEAITEMWRPCGPQEHALLVQSGFKAWPPRLYWQPFFYPVTNKQYAIDVNKWNVQEKGIGYVTHFFVKTSFMSRYPIQQVGKKYQTEWWIPSEELPELNANLVGLIQIALKMTAQSDGTIVTVEL